jgi:glycosidase/outer membrane lipoprotein-sorting protein
MLKIFIFTLIFVQSLLSQIVPVTFYYKPQTPVNAVFLAGSFNNWGNNVNGIVSDTTFRMRYDASNGVWYKVQNLGIGTYEYKFVEDRNGDGKGETWITDPNNPRINYSNYNNSILIVSDPMVFHLLPKHGTITNRDQPEISAYIFYSSGTTISEINLYIDGVLVPNGIIYFNPGNQKFSYTPSQPLSNGQHFIKLEVKTSTGKTASDTSRFTVDVTYRIYQAEYEFIFDPRSSRNSYRNITSVSLRGEFNNWGEDPMQYDSLRGVWTKTLKLTEGEYEYKFYLNGSIWTADPDNPVTRGTYGNSVAYVSRILKPYFKVLNPPNGKIYSDTVNSINVIAKVFDSSREKGINPNSVKVYLDGVLIQSNYDTATKTVTAQINNLTLGRHELKFEASDKDGNYGVTYSAFGVYPSNSGFHYVDNTGDDLGDGDYVYPNGFSPGSCDIQEFNVRANQTGDTIFFTIKLRDITQNTSVAFLINSAIDNFIPDPFSAEIKIPDFSDRGFYIIFAPGANDPKFNAVYTKTDPLTKVRNINYNASAAITSDTLKFYLTLDEIVNYLGSFSGKLYYAIYSFLIDANGNAVKITSTNGGNDQNGNPKVFDLAFIDDAIQRKILSYYVVGSSPILASIDNEGRGFAGITPSQIGIDMSGVPIVKITTQPRKTRKTSITIRGEITHQDGTPANEVTYVEVFINGNKGTFGASGGKFSVPVNLVEGDNIIQVKATIGNKSGYSNKVNIYRIVEHKPFAKIKFSVSGSNIVLDASESSDPNSDPLTFVWFADSTNPEIIPGVNGSTTASVTISKPSKPGEYYFTLIARDPAGNADTTRNYFEIRADGSVYLPGYADNPSWVKNARMYLVFLHSFTQEGTIRAATQKLDYVKSMGYNVIWLMPIMKNQYTIDAVGAGYGIVDFYQIAPEYGTMDDFKEFLNKAHSLGIKVILDITPNHVADGHPWIQSIRRYWKDSPYWDFVQHEIFAHNEELPQSYAPDSAYVRYADWTLANLNWSDVDLRSYMLDVLKWWVKDVGVDGFRFDVYWGPQRRYGEQNFGIPIRNTLKHVKPDILLLAEAAGTGPGTEVIYADKGGGVDAAYDRNMWNVFRNAYSLSLNEINDRATNYGYYPGPNSQYLRYMENQDETRIALVYQSDLRRTKPLATILFTIPGIPLVHAGQEVGFGNGMNEFEGRRFKINWNDPDKEILQSHYQRLAFIRDKFPAFRSREHQMISTNDPRVYAYVKKYENQNGLVIVNLSADAKTVNLNVKDYVLFTGGVQPGQNYYLNDLFSNSYSIVNGDALQNISVTLEPYGSVVFTISLTRDTVSVPPIVSVKDGMGEFIPRKFKLYQNYPNPFNPSTFIEFDIPERAKVRLAVHDVLGREIKVLIDGELEPGRHRVKFDSSSLPTGVYFYRLSCNGFSEMRKMVLIK